DATEFRLERSLNGRNGPFFEVDTYPADDVPEDPNRDTSTGDYRVVEDDQLETHTSYCYRVLALKGTRESAPSKARCTITPATCNNNSDCSNDEYCAFALGDCGGAGGDGVCRIVGGQCGGGFDPVCGCDDRTYPSPCEAAQARTSVAYAGECVCTSNADCNDGPPCTTGVCNDGECSYPATTCNDNDPCTADSCVPNQGCVFEPGACDNGDDAFEPDDTWNAATEVGTGTYNLQGWDDDWFAIHVLTPGTLTLKISGNQGDLDFELYAAGNLQNFVSNSESSGSNEQINYQASVGWYYARVFPWEQLPDYPAAGSPYTLEVQLPSQGGQPDLCTNDAQCDDGDPCTLDSCDPNLGCTNQPGACDGNPSPPADQGTVLVQAVPGVSGVIPSATYHPSGGNEPIAAFLDNEGDGLVDFVEGGNANINFPVDDANNDGNLQVGSGYSGEANIIVVAKVNGGTDFVAVHIAEEYAAGTYYLSPVRLLAGDYSTAGKVMSADGPVPGDAGQISDFTIHADSAWPFLHLTVKAVPRFADTWAGVMYSNEIEFECWVTLVDD
ncbi:MAG: pre-peptidase C-terminal domain-containing protein, partial [Phycisphaerae bacterium]